VPKVTCPPLPNNAGTLIVHSAWRWQAGRNKTNFKKVSLSPARLRLDLPAGARVWQVGEVLAGGPQL